MNVLGKVVSSGSSLSGKGGGSLVLGGLLGKDGKGEFLNLVFSEMKGVSRARGFVLDFLKFLKNNGLVGRKSKGLSLSRSFAFEKLSDDSFMADLRSLIKKMGDLSDLGNFKALGEILSDTRLLDREEVLKNIEKFLFDNEALLGDRGSLLSFDVLNMDLDTIHRDFDFERKDRGRNVINIDVKNFRSSGGFKELFNLETGFRVVDGSSVGKYSLKESFNGMGGFVGDLYGSDTARNIKPLIGGVSADLMSEWDLKVNQNIVDKARVVLKSNDTGEIRLIIRPKELGSVRINLNLDSGNNLLGRIIVDNQNVRALFEQNMYSISKMLDDNGFNTSLSLSLAGSDSGVFSGCFKDESGGRESFFDEDKVFRLEDSIEISDDLEKSINFIV
ncbi:flagellar hook-length control protein FliK [Borrelia sp. BU AG58]|uniref:flagellar hook-length control protein FliK n=1 Tax=Borrelia sp. BU AG58 TaxID=2887345 RepID=UPI001E59051B|nr:flagellar hook-length control protein FliK [Borrelia sp. BU AG58]UER67475.1 flagellar hook-length control protein FliK [Borrelia sp. BU AG58]